MKRHANLIPIAFRRHQLTARYIRRWAVAWGCVLAFGGMLWNRQHAVYLEWQERVEQLDQQYEPIREIGKKSEITLNEIEHQRIQTRWLLSLEQAEVPLITLAAVHQSIDTLHGRVQLERLRFEGLDTPAPPRPTNLQALNPGQTQPIQRPPIPVNDQVDLFGSGIDDDAVSDLISHLEATRLFAKVELISLQAQGTLKRDFQIRCRVQAEVEQLDRLAQRLNGPSPFSTASNNTPESTSVSERVANTRGSRVDPR